jgi:beta-1,4-mannosyl-glycoprotein beta-1,4-N-acetylglucosaminyltransferase
MKKIIYDCFLFNGELELLELRLNILEELDCYFVILEAGETHRNQPKSFYYEENKELYKKWHDRILYLKMPSLGFAIPKHNEWFCRNLFYEIVRDSSESDYFMLSDLDEIPCPKKVEKYIHKNLDEPFCLSNSNFMYKLNLQCLYSWPGTVVFQRKYLLYYDEVDSISYFASNGVGFQRLREIRAGFIQIPGGWHYSWCFSEAEIARKLSNYSHPEMDTPEVNNERNIRECISKRVSFYPGAEGLRKVPLSNENCSDYLLQNLDKYKHLIDQNE